MTALPDICTMSDEEPLSDPQGSGKLVTPPKPKGSETQTTVGLPVVAKAKAKAKAKASEKGNKKEPKTKAKPKPESTVVKKRPSACLADETTPIAAGDAAAGAGKVVAQTMKRPASKAKVESQAKRCYKYQYWQKGKFGFKIDKKEVMTVP